MTDLVVPRLGVTVTQVTIIEWLVEDGAQVCTGDPVVTVATDKIETELEATCDGVLRHRAAPDEEHAVDAVIGVIE